MSTAEVAINLTELETLIRRVVREEVTRAIQESGRSILDDWGQEGPDDEEGDEELLAEALVMSERIKANQTPLEDWEDFKRELKVAEAAGELPD